MKLIAVILTSLVNVNLILAHNSAGDYRTRLSGGYWHTVSNWQVYFNGDWRDLGNASAGPFRNIIPSSVAGKIAVRHSISILTNLFINQLRIEGNGRVIINSGAAVVFVDDFTEAPLTIETNGVLTNNVGIVDFQSQLVSTPCQIDGTLESASTLLSLNPLLISFNNGSVYKHLNRSGGNIPFATWDINSTCVIAKLSNNLPAKPNNLGQDFGNFTWNTPDMGSSPDFSLGGDLHTVKGNLSFISTGNPLREVRLHRGGEGYTLFVGKNLTIANGVLILTEDQTTSTSIKIGGDLTISGGSLILGRTNNFPLLIFLKGALIKTNGVLMHGNGSGVCRLLPFS